MRRIPIFLAVAISLTLAAGCASTPVSDIGGVDMAGPVVRPFADSLHAAAASQQLRAQSIRQDQRSLAVAVFLASGQQPGPDTFAKTLCGGYDAMDHLQRRALEMQLAENGLDALIGKSPDTILGLIAAAGQGAQFPGGKSGPKHTAPAPAAPEPATPKLIDQCRDVADDAAFSYPAPDSRRVVMLSSVLYALGVFSSILRPVIIQGLTQVDRVRRMQALRAWAADEENGLPRLRETLRAARTSAAQAAAQDRLLAAGVAYAAWDDLVNAARTDPGDRTACPEQAEHMSTLCVRQVEEKFARPISAYLASAQSFDKVFDADPTAALRASERAADHLEAWLRGDFTEQDVALYQAAAVTALAHWLDFLAACEKLTQDSDTKRRLGEAADQLGAALSGGK